MKRRGARPDPAIAGARPQHGPPTVTIALPPIAVPAAVHVHEAAPAVVTKHNPGHVGMTAPELLRVLRAMRADPRFRDTVICYGKSYRGAAPADIVAFMRAAAAPLTMGEQEGDGGVDANLLAATGYELCPRGGVGEPRRRVRPIDGGTR